MFKRIFAALLLGCMLCLAFAGCGKTDLEKSQEYMNMHPLEEDKLYSVSFCLVSDAAIDPVVLSGMQAEFNRYTEGNYNIHVEFTNVTAAEYAAWLEEKFTAVEAANAIRLAEEAEVSAAKAEYERISKQEDAKAIDKLTAELNYDVANAAYLAKTMNWSAEVVAEINAHLDAAREAFAQGKTTTGANEMYNAESLITLNRLGTRNSGSIGSDIRQVYPEIKDYQFDIIYIESYEMLSSLIRAGRLRDMTEDLNSKDYRLIKKQMTEKFFESAKLGGKIYGVSSCRVMANYNYMRVNVEKANYYNYTLKKELSDYDSTSMLRQAITAEGGNFNDYVQKDISGDYNYRTTLEEDGTWWVYASAQAQLPEINQTDLMNGMLSVTAYAYVDDGGTKLTQDDDFCPAIKLLYALYSERALHTVLQYGQQGLTYTLDTAENGNERATVVEKITTTGYTYDVDPKYTGNSFSLYPTREEFMNGTQNANKIQNSETRIKKEIYAVDVATTNADCQVAVSCGFGKVGETVTLTATPAEGFRFVNWFIKGEDGDEDDIKSTSAVYDYTIIAADVTITAQFEAVAAEE